MLQEVRELQNTAVNRLVEKTNELDNIIFKSPTGSGKTYMMASMMDQLLDDDEDLVFLVSCLSKGELAEQNYEAFLNYQEMGQFKNINPFLINADTTEEEGLSIPENYNVYVLPKDLYRAKAKLMQGAMDGFLRNLTNDKVVSGLGKHIYLIKDEGHQATKNIDRISDKYFDKIYSFSATPKLKKGQSPDVEIKDVDAVNSKLIKKVLWGDDDESLETAVKKYKDEIQPYYNEHFDMNPCLIVQISNKDKAEQELNETILPVLDKYNLNWMYIVDEDRECMTNTIYNNKPVGLWKKEAKKDSSVIEVIIFKLTISEGWDIKRACMLYQIRDTDSKQLDEQVLGRVRRNPILLNYEDYNEDEQEYACKSWVWGIRTLEEIDSVQVELANKNVKSEFKVKTTILKDLEEDEDFNIQSIIDDNNGVTSKSIFKLYKEYNKSNDEIRTLGKDYIESYQDWLSFTSNISSIKREYNQKKCDYKKSMELLVNSKGAPLLSELPDITMYDDTNNYIDIDNHIWKRLDNEENFAYDSEAEMKFAGLLCSIASNSIKQSPEKNGVYLWGKNYLYGSEIKYEYYLDGTHFSYPDFIMKDKKDRIHIFEVKSVNGNSVDFEADNYINKINELKKCYLYASKLTQHIFYLPILEDRTWKIYRFKDGDEDTINKQILIDSLKE
ncbi:MAG: DEAD/DEAH box helicase family protein [Eubacterium sp.]|nr:DEAD/DEAH box helicase family protein [Eubacterium sp.]